MSILNEGITMSIKKRLIKAKPLIGLLLLCICLMTGCDRCPPLVFEPEDPIEPEIREVKCLDSSEKVELEDGSYPALPAWKGIEIQFLVTRWSRVAIYIDGIRMGQVNKNVNVELLEGGGYYIDEIGWDGQTSLQRWVVHVFAPKLSQEEDRGSYVGYKVEIRSSRPPKSGENERISKSMVIQFTFRKPTVKLTADPAWLNSSGSVKLTAVATLARLLRIERHDKGDNFTTIDQIVRLITSAEFLEQTLTVNDNSVTKETTYRAVAKGPGGDTSSECTVEVIPLPEVTSLIASPVKICPGGKSKLTWELNNASSHTLSWTKEGGEIETEDLTGKTEYTVYPGKTTEYTITAYNKNGEQPVSASVTVSVGQVLEGEKEIKLMRVENGYNPSHEAIMLYNSDVVGKGCGEGYTAYITSITTDINDRFTLMLQNKNNGSNEADVNKGEVGIGLIGKEIAGYWSASWQSAPEAMPNSITIWVKWTTSKNKK